MCVSAGENKMWNFLKEISTNGDMQVRKQGGSTFIVYTIYHVVQIAYLRGIRCRLDRRVRLDIDLLMRASTRVGLELVKRS